MMASENLSVNDSINYTKDQEGESKHASNVLSTPKRLIKAMRTTQPRSISLPQALHSTYSKTGINEGSVSGGEDNIKVSRSTTEPKLSHYLAQDDTETLAIRRSTPHTQDTIIEEIEESEEQLSFSYDTIVESASQSSGKASLKALNDPDILAMIFAELDSQTIVPHELVQQRRKPLSLRHAQLIFGKTPRAVEAWQRQIPTTTHSEGSGLYNCLFVNKTWHEAARKVLERVIHFKSNDKWVQFARRGVHNLSRQPKALVLHKLLDATQVELEMIQESNLSSQLEWLEFYTCPRICPTPELLGPQLKKIVLPGSNRVSDLTLMWIAERCPQLVHLDLRACDKVSDSGVKLIARFCPNLELLNLGRTSGGSKITYKAVKHLARLTNIRTLGLAGCSIDDRAVWELALNRGPLLQRLSLNGCKLLTDASIPRVVGYMPNLTVLEIRGCLQIANLRPIALFKQYRENKGQPLLIEGCELIERRLQVACARVQREKTYRCLSDLTYWINS